MKAIVTVIGKDKSGIVAGVSAKLAQLDANILDINQTIFDDYFAMMMMVEVAEKADFMELKAKLAEYGESLAVKIYIQNAAIFEAMHNL
jgi:ACT domain-containing protein